MPAKNIVKTYVEGGYYHLYNRGVNKRKIFFDDQDYRYFLFFLKSYLQPETKPEEGEPVAEKSRFESIAKEIQLLAYCLMPNHFHLLVKQFPSEGITKLARRVFTAYVRYFNERYQRQGGLFQGNYKAVLVDSEDQLLHLSRYLHLNPLDKVGGNVKKLSDYPYSSYPYFLGLKKASWLHPEEILSYFRSDKSLMGNDILSYQSFVEDFVDDERTTTQIKGLVLEDYLG
ncbi:transposase [Patescibacteria group bacterium]